MTDDFERDYTIPEERSEDPQPAPQPEAAYTAPVQPQPTETQPEAPCIAPVQPQPVPPQAETFYAALVRPQPVPPQPAGAEHNSYVWTDAAQNNQKKKRHGGRAFGISLLAIFTCAVLVLASIGVVHIAQSSGGNQPTVSSSETPVEQKTGFELSGRTETDELAVTDVAQKIRPAVVGVVNYTMNSLTASGYGSGVIINAEGYIVTNYHVIEGADRVKIVLYDKTEALASIVGSDEQTDLAVLRVIEDENVKHSDLVYASFGNSDEVQLAETVVAIGNPGGLEFAGSVTRGIVSGINVKTELSGNVKLIQTDAAINPGNSGGPLIDLYGNVIGITSQKIVDTQYEGMGFAIPSNTVKPIVDSILTYGYVPGRPMIGISGNTIDEYVAYFNNVPRGVLITSVDANTDAAAKGLKKNDIITSIGGVTVKTMDELNAEKEKYSAGDTVELGIYRYSEGRSFTVSIVLSEYKPTETLN
ncbi:MAG: trypsin-like peptidase domain-containing protein [Clostridia bacterium]|nr:trypsin-like peptidase domain-containing protein [Clostridia bacterium]